jgi:L-ascorbate metabolism protein UlaG (beta-lactamase superfamily)
MATPVFPPFLDFLLHRRARHANDASAAAELNWRNFDAEWPAGLELQWLGTAGFRFSYEDVHVLVDPYFTRPRMGPIMRRRALVPSAEAVSRYAAAADAVLVGHTHFDHALDVPAIAARHRCDVYGSSSMRHLMGLHGLADLAVAVEPYRIYEVGPFQITFVPSVHSKLLLGLKIPAEGELTCNHLDELTAGNFKCGDVYGIHIRVAGATFYHQGSADLIDDALRHRDVDYFLCGIAGRGYSPRYLERILPALSPRVIIPNHHDNFFRKLDEPMGFSLNVNFGGFIEEVGDVSKDFAIHSLDLLQVVD